MRAKDIMTSPVVTVPQIASVETATELVTRHGVTALPVVDTTGRLVGMVSEGDLLLHRVPADPAVHLRRDWMNEPGQRPGMVVEVMTTGVVTTEPEADVADVAARMLEFDVRSVPVLDDGVVVGIVSRRDILRSIVHSDETLAREVRHRLDEYADGQHRWTVTVEGGVAQVTGEYDSDAERAVVEILARTVPGIWSVRM
ncbi:CBS domain-containing protein [Actinoplanes sp. NPDC049265]|uniref:CBS domain-containing protein n=1 Tax=Actinoplanes sp. NPDC049265 TaxID=3363902 RepID=UPI003719EFAD